MTKTKKNLFLIIIIALLFLTMGILCACGNEDDKIVITISGSGSVTKHEEDDTTYYVATPNKWYDFVGWYNGNNKIEDKQELKITNSMPREIVAKFVSSGYQSTDRTLAALYNNYVLGSKMQGDYYDIKTNFKFNYCDDEMVKGDNGKFRGFVSFAGEGIELSFKTTNFEVIYADDTQTANLYINNNGEKSAYKDLSLISSIWTELENYTETWTIENVFSEKLEQFFKINLDSKNTLGIVLNAENNDTNTILELNLGRMLTFFKNNSTFIKSNPIFNKLIEILTKHYTQTIIPDIILKYNVEYENKDDKECIKEINIKIEIPRKYYIVINEKEVVIPKSTMELMIKDIEYNFGDEGPDDNFETFPTPDQRILNFNLDGNMYFKNQSEIIDNYSIQLYADLNPTALLIGDGDLEKVDWGNLGFLNFKITLIEDETEEGRIQQEERHKSSKDYINILIDSKKYGSKALVYVGLYQPESVFTLEYYVNHSFDLSELANLKEPYNDPLDELNQNRKIKNYIYTLLLNLLNASMQLNSGVASDKVITDFIFSLIGEEASKSLKENIIDDEHGKTFNIQNLRSKIKEYEEGTIRKYMNIVLPIKLDELILGSADEITQITFKFNNIERNCVISNENGEFFDKNGKNLENLYNSAHPTIVDITGEFAFLKETFTTNDIENLKDIVLTATEITYSDGMTSTTFTNNKGIEEDINFKVIKVKVEKVEDGKAYCKLLLQIKDNPKLTNTISFGELLYKITGIPYGLLSYNVELTLS